MFASLSQVFGAAFRAGENPTTFANPAKWLMEFVTGGGASAAGVAVTEDKALGVPTAYACARIISEAFASLPCHVYERKDKLSVLAPEHWAQPLLAEAPNPLQTAFTWREQLAVHALFWGNHCSAIDMDARGEVMFLPLLPWNVKPRLTSTGKRKVYVVRLMDGSEKEFREDQILHIPAIGTDGIWGIPPVRQLRNMYGLALATENFGSRFFANDARPGVILETPGKMKEDAQKNLVESLYAKFSDAKDKWKVLVLEEGVKMHTVQMPLEDAQFLETRKMSAAEICGVFKVPPHMLPVLMDKQSSWGTGIEQMDIAFAKHTILPWCRKVELELKRKIFAGTDFFAKFSLDGLQRGDFKSRMDGYQVGIQNGVYLIDEVRELEDRPPLPDGLGQLPIMAANMTTLKKLQLPDPPAKGNQA